MADSVVAGRPRWCIAPYFVVDDVVATANYYREKLGFGYDRFWNDPPSFCMVRRSGVVIMLAQLEQPGVMRPNRLVDPEGGAWDTYVWIDDADALHTEFKSKGVKIVAMSATNPMAVATSISKIATVTDCALARSWRDDVDSPVQETES
jgi:hypothetical protein